MLKPKHRNSKITSHTPFSMRKGAFSLVEIIVYIALFSVLSVVITRALISSAQIFNQLRIARDINDSAISVMERLTREIRNANSVNLSKSDFSTSPSRLVLNTTDALSAPITIEFFVATSSLRIKEGDVDKGPLSSGKTSVDTFRLFLVNNTNSSAIKIELFLSGRRGPVDRQEVYYNTVVLRGAY
ncbi:MAG: hypothetical protein A3D65_01225 [Candidatus Lloydbacteria bacterium RIFCSPHIGHO2_02_FULL_50_13]|uniref:Prepilin-type N-terminal cleavage/methylation domain-containing protein n=1 Tax=Candidatus Lloydbacteria bacterium RIFCSPHIGHO2_02_FULL_50_13 TaxID=1798661 RepID=A0A1G2D517_9BACT|nr:MAG: hypothetical protein A3D65_01225 [Candidatus Lloydbacteria bacterium RIFCSPHIGHO2_02_FULL_50_13]